MHTRSSQASHAILTESVNQFRDVFDFSTTPEAWDINTLDGLASVQAELARQATMIAYNNTFLAVALLAFIAIPFAYLFKRVPHNLRVPQQA